MTVLISLSMSAGKKRRCDAHCYNGKHTRCRCICGGRNHGKGLDNAVQNTRDSMKDIVDAGLSSEKLNPDHVKFDDLILQVRLLNEQPEIPDKTEKEG